MHHQDSTGEPPLSGTRRTSYNYRRGSGGTSAASSSGAPCVPVEDGPSGQPSLATHHPLATASGPQVKKKSGFQITSVTSAQISVSGNNSLADDTESYDDMDESHTEDLSSSDLLDVSVPRAVEVTGRSSSDETLNSLHGVDTPGLVSPNEHVHANALMVNGSVYPHLPSHHPEATPGGDPVVSSLPAAPLASSTPTIASKSDNKASGGIQTSVSDMHLHSSIPLAVSDSNTGDAQPAHTQSQPQTQTGSRFRVVKLDTNSEPFRKGRWTCTEYYEKEVSHPAATTEAPKGSEVSEAEPASHGFLQDFSSPPVVQSPPQQLPQTAPLTYISLQDGSSVGKTMIPPHHPQAVYPAVPLHTHTGGVARQPDFIRPTAPFQTQVQPPPAAAPGPGPSLAHQLGVPNHTAPASQPVLPTPRIPAQPQPPVLPINMPAQPVPRPVQPVPIPLPVQPVPLPAQPVPLPPHHISMPLTTLHADLQPLLAPAVGFGFSSSSSAAATGRSSHLEDAHRLLFQHQGLLALPRLGGQGASGAGGTVEGLGSGAVLGHMGMSAEASALMAAAAGLQSQTDGDDDSSSGASVVAIDNKIEQAMDLVKSHLMYAVREEVEVLKEQIKELIERNSQLEQENTLLKTLASPEQMAQFQAQVQTGTSPTGPGPQPLLPSTGPQASLPPPQNMSA